MEHFYWKQYDRSLQEMLGRDLFVKETLGRGCQMMVCLMVPLQQWPYEILLDYCLHAKSYANSGKCSYVLIAMIIKLVQADYSLRELQSFVWAGQNTFWSIYCHYNTMLLLFHKSFRTFSLGAWGGESYRLFQAMWTCTWVVYVLFCNKIIPPKMNRLNLINR